MFTYILTTFVYRHKNRLNVIFTLSMADSDLFERFFVSPDTFKCLSTCSVKLANGLGLLNGLLLGLGEA
jgi:hypothetical protein